MSHFPHVVSWDDLRIVKAIGESGSLVSAAAALSLNHSTISRRLAVIEQTLGTVLFDRRRKGYVPTSAGAEVIALAERVELDVFSVLRRVSSYQHSHQGDLRVTTSDALLLDFLTPVVADFQSRNPGVRIETIVSNKPLNLANGESDIAFRATISAPDNLFGRKLATVAWAVYGRGIDYVGAAPAYDELYNRKWVSYGRGLAGLKAFSFINDRVDAENIVYRSDSVSGVALAISSGLGIGLLPCMHGDLVSSLVRISPVQPEVYDELWVLTHPDIRKSGRVYAFMTHCADAVMKHRKSIEGK
jgi:DNA-binding transcriptional LysR family regulator